MFDARPVTGRSRAEDAFHLFLKTTTQDGGGRNALRQHDSGCGIRSRRSFELCEFIGNRTTKVDFRDPHLDVAVGRCRKCR
jgi:hypothetical protein